MEVALARLTHLLRQSLHCASCVSPGYVITTGPQMFLFLVQCYLAIIGYIFVDRAEDRRPAYMRTAALVFALIGGFWDVFTLFPLQVAVWFGAGAAAVLAMVLVVQNWRTANAKTR